MYYFIYIGKLFIRLISIGVGSLIEYREIYSAKDAQWSLVLLGLWFIVIPPALWLDSLRRLMKISENTSEPNPIKNIKENNEKNK